MAEINYIKETVYHLVALPAGQHPKIHFRAESLYLKEVGTFVQRTKKSLTLF
jgi:hypothetical protein